MTFKLSLSYGPIAIKHTKTDFVIVSQTGKEIPCHKFVLAAMSPVYDAMFEMKDSKEVLDDHRLNKRDDSPEATPMKCSDLPMTVLVAMYPDLGKIASLRRNPT